MAWADVGTSVCVMEWRKVGRKGFIHEAYMEENKDIQNDFLFTYSYKGGAMSSIWAAGENYNEWNSLHMNCVTVRALEFPHSSFNV